MNTRSCESGVDSFPASFIPVFGNFMQGLTRAEGHLIGNHTYSHMQFTKGNREKFKEELVKTNEIIKEITGEDVQYVRPPYGSWDKSFEKELNMFPVLWNVAPPDWCSGNIGCIVEKIVSNKIFMIDNHR